MKERLLHTPEGVRDIYNSELKKKMRVVEHIHHVLEMYSYNDIETPAFEYFDIFNMDKGSAPSNEMYKFFDRNNNTLVLRPDITPSIARCVAKYFPDEELPIRLCYKGNTFTNAHQHQGKLSESTQIGCELINDDSSAADAEIIACVIECLLSTGLKEFEIEIGEVEYFKGLIEEAGVDADTEQQIREYIRIKNFFGLQEFVKGLDISEDMKTALSCFDTLFGGLEMLDKAAGLTKNKKALEAIQRMKKIYNVLTYYGYESYVGFDLSMLNRYNYYTGVVFRAYTHGTGDAVVKGGRYNNLLKKFGKDAPSIGFAIFVDELMMAISRQNIDIDTDIKNTLILYNIENQKNAVILAAKLRKNGSVTELVRKSRKHDLNNYIDYAKREHISGIYYFENDETVIAISLVDETRQTVNYSEL